MRLFTVHIHGTAPPVLVREGFSWGAFLFGPLWLLVHRAWIAAVLWAALCGVPFLLPPGWGVVAGIAIAWCAGLVARDLVRWSLERRGYVLAHVVAAPDREAALARVLAVRGDQVPRFLPRPERWGRLRWAWLP